MEKEEQKLRKELREVETQLDLLNQKKEQIEFRLAMIRQGDKNDNNETRKDNSGHCIRSDLDNSSICCDLGNWQTGRLRKMERKILEFVAILEGNENDVKRVENEFFEISEREEVVILLAKKESH